MRYYEGHEFAYKQLQEKGYSSWDEYLKQAGSFESFCLRSFLEGALAKCTFDGDRPSALEIGCGTGPACCFLAEHGFSVEGIDISATAVEVARNEAGKRGHEINYHTGDICRDDFGEDVYDLVLDGHCMHCIVFDEDRHKALATVRRALKPEGYFWMDTMLANGPISFEHGQILDEDGILWARLANPEGIDSTRQIGDAWYVASRRIHADPARLSTELETAGLKIEWQEVEAPEKENEPGAYRAICRPAPAQDR